MNWGLKISTEALAKTAIQFCDLKKARHEINSAMARETCVSLDTPMLQVTLRSGFPSSHMWRLYKLSWTFAITHWESTRGKTRESGLTTVTTERDGREGTLTIKLPQASQSSTICTNEEESSPWWPQGTSREFPFNGSYYLSCFVYRLFINVQRFLITNRTDTMQRSIKKIEKIIFHPPSIELFDLELRLTRPPWRWNAQ